MPETDESDKRSSEQEGGDDNRTAWSDGANARARLLDDAGLSTPGASRADRLPSSTKTESTEQLALLDLFGNAERTTAERSRADEQREITISDFRSLLSQANPTNRKSAETEAPQSDNNKAAAGERTEAQNTLQSNDTTRDASRLKEEFDKLAQGDRGAELRIREMIATQSAQMNRSMAEEFQRRTGTSLQQFIAESQLSPASKQALEILMKGPANRTVEDNIQLARIGLQHRDIHMMELGLRGDPPSRGAEARQQLQNDSAFVQQVNDTFQNSAIARDILRQGRISLETIADLNNGSGLFGTSNRLNLEHALSTATPEERRAYAAGRELELEARRTGRMPQLTSEQEQDLNFYRRTHAALESITAGAGRSSDIHSSERPDAKQILKDRLQLDEEQIARLRTDANYRREVEARISGTPETQVMLASLIERASRGEDVSRLNAAENLLYDKISGASPYRTLLNAEELLKNDPERQERLRRLADNPNFLAPIEARTQEEYERKYRERQEDISLLNVIRSAAREALARSGEPNNALNPVGRALANLLANGSLDALSVASLGFPPSIVSERLAGADESTRRMVQERFANRYGDRAIDRTNGELSRLEDLLLTGGSLAGRVAALRSDPEAMLSSIEQMTVIDYARAKDPAYAAQMRREMERSLEGVSQELRARALELYDRKAAAASYREAMEVRRSPLDVAAGNKAGLVESVYLMGAADRQRYRSDSQFRAQVDARINQNLSGEQKIFAQMMLERMRAGDGSVPRVDQMTPVERLLYNSTHGADAFTLYRDLERVLASRNDRQRIMSFPESPLDRALNALTARVARELQFSPEARIWPGQVLRALRTEGRLNDQQVIALENIAKADRLARLVELQKTDPAAARRIAEHLLRNDPTGRAVLENIRSQNGEVRISDRIAAGDIKSAADLNRELGRYTEEQMRALQDEYARKYGRSMDGDILARIPERERAEAIAILSNNRNDARNYYFDSLGRLTNSSEGVIPDGTRETSRRTLQLFAEALQRATIDGRQLSTEEQTVLQRAFERALEQMRGSKEEYANRLLRYGEHALMVAGTILAMAASGGTLSPAILAAVAIAGTALTPAARIAVLSFVQGNDFDTSGQNLLRQIGMGLIDGAIVFAPFGVEAATAIAGRAASRLAGDGTISTLNPAARAQVQEALREPLTQALMRGQTSLTEAELRSALRAKGISEDTIRQIVGPLRARVGELAEGEAFAARLARGEGRTSAEYRPFTMGQARVSGNESIDTLNRIGRQMADGNYNEAVNTAISSLGPGVRVQRDLIKVTPSSNVDDLLKQIAQRSSVRVTDEGGRRVITVSIPELEINGRVSQEVLTRLRQEQAISAMEEYFHARRILQGGPISPSYQEFLASGGARLPENLAQEQEVIAALYDAGVPLSQLRRHYVNFHPNANRQAMVDFLERREISRLDTFTEASFKSELADSVLRAPQAVRENLVNQLPRINAEVREQIRLGKMTQEQAENFWMELTALTQTPDLSPSALNWLITRLPEEIKAGRATELSNARMMEVIHAIDAAGANSGSLSALINNLNTAPESVRSNPLFRTWVDETLHSKMYYERHQLTAQLRNDMETMINRYALHTAPNDRAKRLYQDILEGRIQTPQGMRLENTEIALAFQRMHADSRTPLENILNDLMNHRFRSPHELKERLGTSRVDFIGENRVIIDVGGNNYRLIAEIDYQTGRVRIERVMTHAEYDRWTP